MGLVLTAAQPANTQETHMRNTTFPTVDHTRTRPKRAMRPAVSVGLLSLLMAVTACGGGGDSATTSGVGGTSVASGRISGFGSVIVNGVRYDDSGVSAQSDDGSASTLKLGMLVDIRSGDVGSVDSSTGLASATASQITSFSSIKGPVSATSANSITVLGQTIAINTATVFEDYAGGASAIQVGDLVEVYAFQNDTLGNHTATRIEHKTTLSAYKLSGTVANLNGSNFTLGGVTINHTGAASPVPPLSNGLRVRVTLSTTPSGTAWNAARIRKADLSLGEGNKVEIEGVISDYVSKANFKVNGVSIDARGSDFTFANGTRVEVEGPVLNGVLVAQQVKLKNQNGSDDADTRLFGTVVPGSHDAINHTFVIRGVTVHYDASRATTDFRDNLTAADLGTTTRVLEVRGNLATGHGAQVEATRVKYKS